MTGRRMVKGGAARASEIVPPIGGPEVPPHEEQESAVPPEEAAAEVAAAPTGDVGSSLAGARLRLGTRWGETAETVLAIGDPRTLYDRLAAELTLGNGATQYGEILSSADSAERNMLDASRLHRSARLEEESVRLSVLRREEVLRTAAREELDRERAEGKRSKAPTIQDVEDRTVANWPDEIASIRRAKDEIHAVVEVAETLETAWRSRAATLREMLARYAPTR